MKREPSSTRGFLPPVRATIASCARRKRESENTAERSYRVRSSTFFFPSPSHREKYSNISALSNRLIDQPPPTGRTIPRARGIYNETHTHTCANTRNGTKRLLKAFGGGFIACPMDINWAKCQGRLSLLRYGCFALSAGQH